MTDLSVILSDADKAVQALPIVTKAISQVQTDLTNSQHASIVTAASAALTVAAQSAQALGDKGLIGHSDVGNVAEGAVLATEGLTIFDEMASLAEKLKALVKHII